jgi:hypothetical protein
VSKITQCLDTYRKGSGDFDDRFLCLEIINIESYLPRGVTSIYISWSIGKLVQKLA